MTDRRFTFTDTLLINLERAVRTLAASQTDSGHPHPDDHIADAPLDDDKRLKAARLMRVNHAGEVSAQALYMAQALISRDSETRAMLHQAADEERDHLIWCERRIRELNNHPSRLSPLWYAGSYAIGLVAGLAGDRWSLGFVVETENQVIRHLQDHMHQLPPEDQRSRAILEKMQLDEAHHGDTARQAGGRDLPAPLKILMRAVSKVMTTTAQYI